MAERRGAGATFLRPKLCTSVHTAMAMVAHAMMVMPARMVRGKLIVRAVKSCGRCRLSPESQRQQQNQESKQIQTFHRSSTHLPLGFFLQLLQHKPCPAGNVAEYAGYGFDSPF